MSKNIFETPHDMVHSSQILRENSIIDCPKPSSKIHNFFCFGDVRLGKFLNYLCRTVKVWKFALFLEIWQKIRHFFTQCNVLQAENLAFGRVEFSIRKLAFNFRSSNSVSSTAIHFFKISFRVARTLFPHQIKYFKKKTIKVDIYLFAAVFHHWRNR